MAGSAKNMQTRRSDHARVVEHAREGIAPWRRARKHAVQLWRDGTPIETIARWMGVADQWVRKWITRFKQAGRHWSALDDRTTKPHTIHAKRHAHVDDVLAAKQEHPHLGPAKLKIVAQIPLSHDTVHRILTENGLVKTRKKTWRKWRRFERPTPNYLWQLDITQVRLGNGPTCFIATLLDDHSRFVLASRTYEQDPTAANMVQLVRDTIRMWGRPRQVLTDRGCQFTTNSDYAGLFTLALYAWGIRHIRARPRHPRTLGKLERWHRSLKEEWLDHHDQPRDGPGLQFVLNAWVEHYNSERPHWALKYRVPVDVFLAGFMMEDALYRLVNEVS